MAHKTNYDISVELLQKVAKFKDGKLYEFKSRVAQKDLLAIARWLVEQSSVDFFSEKADCEWVNSVADVLMCDSGSLKRVLTSRKELGMKYEDNREVKWIVSVYIHNEKPIKRRRRQRVDSNNQKPIAKFTPIGIYPFYEEKYKQFLQDYNIDNVTTTKVNEILELDSLDLNYVILSLLDHEIPRWDVQDSVLENEYFNELGSIKQLLIAKMLKCRHMAFKVIMSNNRQRKLELIGLIANHKIKEANNKDIVFAFEHDGNRSPFISSKANNIIIIGTCIIKLSALQLAFYYVIAHNDPHTTADMIRDSFIESVKSIYVKLGEREEGTSREWTRDDINKLIHATNKDLSEQGVDDSFRINTRGKKRYIPYFENIRQELHYKSVPQVICLPLPL